MTKAPDAYRYRYKNPLTGKLVWRVSCELWNGQRPYETEALYTGDRALALVAAENEACADYLKEQSDRYWSHYDPQKQRASLAFKGAEKEIRSRTPDDATAALERVKQEAFQEGYEQAKADETAAIIAAKRKAAKDAAALIELLAPMLDDEPTLEQQIAGRKKLAEWRSKCG